MTNALVENILGNIDMEDVKTLVGTKELRTFNGKKMKSFDDREMFYMSIRKFASYSNLTLHNGVLTSYLHTTMPNCVIVRMCENVSYILLCIKDDRIEIVKQEDLSKDQLEEYVRRSK